MLTQNLLSLAIWLPILGGVAVLATGSQRAPLARGLSLAVAVLTLLVTILLYAGIGEPARPLSRQCLRMRHGQRNMTTHGRRRGLRTIRNRPKHPSTSEFKFF